LGGIVVTYKSWRVIFWLQSALAGAAAVLVACLLQETIHRKQSEDLKGLNRKEYVKKLWAWTNPLRVIKLYRYPNLLIVVCTLWAF
jgi:predicted MFS family arabinose efflux permease